MWKLTLIVFLGTFITVRGQTYNCQRKNDCLNDGVCGPDGTCTCVGDYTGYNCAYLSTAVEACTDPTVCQNDGVCYDADNKCACPYGFFGATCEIENFSINCEGDQMTVKMSFETPFQGKVSLKNTKSPVGTSCDFQAQTVGNFDEFTRTIRLGEPSEETGAVCGSDQVTNVTDDVTLESRYQTAVLVQYDAFIYTSLDELWSFTCVHSGVENTVYKEVVGINVSMPDDLTQQAKNKTYSPIAFDVLDQGDGPVPEVMSVGSLFQLHIYLTDDTVYKDLLIVSCTANNSLENSEGDTGNNKEYKIFEGGCPTPKGKWVASEQTSKDNRQKAGVVGRSIQLKAFKFVDSSKVGISCDVRVCKESNDPSCNIPNCGPSGPEPTTAAAEVPAPTPPTEAPPTEPQPAETQPTEAPTEAPTAPPSGEKRRRKRAADDNQRTVSTVITVVDPFDPASLQSKAAKATVEQCLSRTEIVAAIIVVGVVMAILFISCLVLLCLMVRRKPRKNVFQSSPSPAHKNGDRFQIPRPYVNEAYRNM